MVILVTIVLIKNLQFDIHFETKKRVLSDSVLITLIVCHFKGFETKSLPLSSVSDRVLGSRGRVSNIICHIFTSSIFSVSMDLTPRTLFQNT
jgi:hypothetical protein